MTFRRRMGLAGAAGLTAAALAVAAAGHPDRGFDVTVTPPAPAGASRVQVDQVDQRAAATATATAAGATVTAESSSVVVVEGPQRSSGRVVVSNNGSATASTGGNTGDHVTTGPATAVGNETVVIIKEP